MSTLLDIQSDRVRYILKSLILSLKFKALVLLGSKDIQEIFKLEPDEIIELKQKLFRGVPIDTILSLGRTYIVSYLEETSQKDLLAYYLNGEEYTKHRLGLSGNIDNKVILDKLVQDSLLESLECNDLDKKLKCIRTCGSMIGTSQTKSVIDFIAEKLKDIDI